MSINVGQQANDFLVRDWLMTLMMSSTNGGFERRKKRLVLLDEFLSVYTVEPASKVNILSKDILIGARPKLTLKSLKDLIYVDLTQLKL